MARPIELCYLICVEQQKEVLTRACDEKTSKFPVDHPSTGQEQEACNDY